MRDVKKPILSMFLAAVLVFALGAAGEPGFTPVSTAQAIDGLAAPTNLVWDEKTLSAIFDQVAGAMEYTISLTREGTNPPVSTVVVSQPASGTKVSYVFDVAQGIAWVQGVYTFAVTATAQGSNSPTIRSYQFDYPTPVVQTGLLPDPEPRVWDENTFSAEFGRVASATNYVITLNNGIVDLAKVIVANPPSGGTVSHSFETEIKNAGSGAYTYSVTARGLGGLQSNNLMSDPFHYSAATGKLPTPGNPVWDTSNCAAVFDRVANASDYLIKLYKNGSATSIATAQVSDPGSGATVSHSFKTEIENNGTGAYTYTVMAGALGYLPSDLATSPTFNYPVSTVELPDDLANTASGPFAIGGAFGMPIAPAAPIAKNPGHTYRVLSRLNVRAGAGINEDIISKLQTNSIVTILEITADGWGRIQLDDGRTGWVSMRYLMPIGIAAEPGDYTTTANLHVRAGADAKARSLTILPIGTRVTVVDAGQNGFVEICHGNGTAYVHGSYLAAVK